MELDNLTIGELRQLANFMPGLVPPSGAEVVHPFVGRYVLCRCYSAGVHTGILVSLDGDRALLRSSRRLWSWKALSGIALSGVAQNGLASGCNVDTVNPEIALTGVIEVIPCSSAARSSIDEYGK